MKRDMDMVRSILKKVEQAPGNLGEADFLGECDPPVVYYHLELMIAHGLLDGSVRRDWSGDVIEVDISGLTWDGQDFLEAMRNDRVWVRAKKAVAEAVGSTTFDVVKQACSMVALQAVKSQLGM